MRAVQEVWWELPEGEAGWVEGGAESAGYEGAAVEVDYYGAAGGFVGWVVGDYGPDWDDAPILGWYLVEFSGVGMVV